MHAQALEFAHEAGGCPRGAIDSSLHLLRGYDVTIMGVALGWKERTPQCMRG